MKPVRSLPSWRALPWLGALLLTWIAGAAFAQDAADPPSRVAHMSVRQGSVVFAPQGENEWVDLPQNRPITSGDRVWTDRGARAELQLGSATVHVDAQSHLGLSELDERAAHFILQQGTVNARVRELTDGENFEIGTPNVAVRALQAGDYRVDVDAATGETQVTVQSGIAQVFGEGGDSVNLGAGQQAVFAGRFLAQSRAGTHKQDAFAQWAAERNRMEDQSIAARHVPRGVVGYAELDRHGQWSQDPQHGAVWYPQVTVQDWAPYRYGHWSYIAPWGWTWIDDAPWGFAPFHYGRWTMIGQRWAWVPGRMAARPVYSPAMVVFLGGGGGVQFTVGSGPGVGWYPLAPGEAWYPVYRASPRYLGFANFNINLGAHPRHSTHHVWRQRPYAITSVPVDDFRRGRPVHRHWSPVQWHGNGQAQVGVVPPRPDFRRGEERPATRLQAAPPATVTHQPFFGARSMPPAVHEQWRAQREQDRLQRDAERAARDQMRQQEFARQQQDLQRQREQVIRSQPHNPLQTYPRQQDRWEGRRERAAPQQHQMQQQVQQQQAIPLAREPRGNGRWQREGGEHPGNGRWNR